MRFIYFVTLLLAFACQSIKDRTAGPNRAAAANTPASTSLLPKVDANKLTVSLEAREYQKGNVSGLMLVPKLDSRASYIAFSICSTVDFKCIDGQIDGLLPDVVYDAPTGAEQISYQACVVPERALADKCGAKKTLNFNHVGKNSPPMQLALVENTDLTQQLINKGMETAQALTDYINHLGPANETSNADFNFFVSNLLAFDPRVLGRMYVSNAMDDHFDAVRKELAKQRKDYTGPDIGQSMMGIGILSLGSPVLAIDFFQLWKQEHQDLVGETQDYVAAAEKMFSQSAPTTQTSQNVLLAVVSTSLQVLSTDKLQASLLEKLAGIEAEVGRLKTLRAESDVKISTLGK